MPTYQTFKAVLSPQTAFISPLVGDMLFGQLCVTLAQSNGDEALTKLLEGYTEGKPFAVISDVFPSGFLPKPRIPVAILEALDPSLKIKDPTQRKVAKKAAWIPSDAVQNTTAENIDLIKLWKAAEKLPEKTGGESTSETHNSINRLTGTTGEDGFAPYTLNAKWYTGDLDVYCVIDTERFNQKELHDVLTNIGQWGYGKDATVGKGKFTVKSVALFSNWLPKSNATVTGQNQYYWTLAACAPQGLGFDELNSYYIPVTRYPRHGGQTVHASPYKTPLLLADTAAVFTLKEAETSNRLFIGQGLGGKKTPISLVKPETIHQGYAPCIPFTNMPFATKEESEA